MRNIIFLFALFFSGFASAESAQDDTLMRLFSLSTKYVAVLIGGIFLYISMTRLVDMTKDSRDPKNSIGVIVATFFAGGMLLNVSVVGNMLTNTFVGEGYCLFADSAENKSRGTACFNSVQTTTDKYLGELSGKKSELDSSKVAEKMRILFTLFQTIAMLYMMKAIMNLKAIAEGKSNTTYGATILQLVACSFFLNLPAALDMIYNTIKSFKV